MLSLSLVLACVSVLLRLCAASSFDADDIGKCCGFLNDDADDETLVDCTFRSNPGRVCRVYYHATRGKYAPANNIVCKSEIECCHGGRAGCAGKSSGEKCYTSDSQYRKGEVYIFGSTDPLTQLGGTCEEKDIVHVKVKNSYGRWSTSRQCTGGVTEKIYECVGYTKGWYAQQRKNCTNIFIGNSNPHRHLFALLQWTWDSFAGSSFLGLSSLLALRHRVVYPAANMADVVMTLVTVAKTQF